MPQKRKAPSRGSSRPAQQTKLDQHFAVLAREQCPHCPEAFSSVQQLIEHVETAHLADVGQHSDSGSAPAVTAQTHPQHAHPTVAPQAQAAWWQQPPSDPVVAHVRFTRGPGPNTQPLQPVRLSALSSVAPVELVRNALPAALANSLLAELLAQSKGWVAGSWWFGGQQQTAPRSSATYCLGPQVRGRAWSGWHDMMVLSLLGCCGEQQALPGLAGVAAWQ